MKIIPDKNGCPLGCDQQAMRLLNAQPQTLQFFLRSVSACATCFSTFDFSFKWRMAILILLGLESVFESVLE